MLKSTLCPNKFLILSIQYLIILGHSNYNPQAITNTSLDNLIGVSISGQNIPEFPISVHFFKSGW